MSETKWTKGKWELGLHVRGERFVEVWAVTGNENTERAVCKVWFGGSRDEANFLIPGTRAEEKANAHLIAAAPCLYAQLAHLVRLMEPLETDGKLDIPGLATLNGARAALAAARGESACGQTTGDTGAEGGGGAR